jgi:hypothetical protein
MKTQFQPVRSQCIPVLERRLQENHGFVASISDDQTFRLSASIGWRGATDCEPHSERYFVRGKLQNS